MSKRSLDRLFFNPSGTKVGGGRGGGARNEPAQYLKNDKCYKPETLGGVRGILQGLKNFKLI